MTCFLFWSCFSFHFRLLHCIHHHLDIKTVVIIALQDSSQMDHLWYSGKSVQSGAWLVSLVTAQGCQLKQLCMSMQPVWKSAARLVDLQGAEGGCTFSHLTASSYIVQLCFSREVKFKYRGEIMGNFCIYCLTTGFVT